MTPNSLRIVVILLGIITTQWACRTERDAVAPSGLTDISIEEAKAWATQTSQTAGGRVGATDRKSYRNEYWNDAIKELSSNGTPLVIVPMTYQYERVVAYFGDNPKAAKQLDKDNHFVQSKLVIYKDARNTMQAYVIRIIPTEENRAKYKRVKGDAFSGYMYVYDRDETQTRGAWIYKDGKVTGWFNTSGSKNGRLSETCYYRQYIPLGDSPPSHVGGSTDDRQYVKIGDTTYEVVTISAPCSENTGGGVNPTGGSGGSDSPGGGGGYPGPTGGGDNGNLESSRLYNFVFDMANNWNVYFDNDEKDVIREYPDLMNVIPDYVQQYGEKPDGSKTFKLSDADQQNYKRFTALVKGLSAFVGEHDRVKQALIRHTNLPWNKIKVLLAFNSGPRIIIMNLKPLLGDVIGHTTHPGYPESTIQIQDSYVRGLEAANLNSTKEATAFLLIIALLHEITHYGAVDSGRNEIRYSDEFGSDFEREVLGTLINKENANQLYMNFYKP